MQITPSQWCEVLWNCVDEHLLAPAKEGSDRGLKGREGIELAESEEGARLNVHFISLDNKSSKSQRLNVSNTYQLHKLCPVLFDSNLASRWMLYRHVKQLIPLGQICPF